MDLLAERQYLSCFSCYPIRDMNSFIVMLSILGLLLYVASERYQSSVVSMKDHKLKAKTLSSDISFHLQPESLSEHIENISPRYI